MESQHRTLGDSLAMLLSHAFDSFGLQLLSSAPQSVKYTHDTLAQRSGPIKLPSYEDPADEYQVSAWGIGREQVVYNQLRSEKYDDYSKDSMKASQFPSEPFVK